MGVHLARVEAAVGQGVALGRIVVDGRADEGLGQLALLVAGQGKFPGGVDEGPRTDVLLGERKDRAHTQGVAGGQTAGKDVVPARRDERVPHVDGLADRAEDLEAELPGVAGAGEQYGDIPLQAHVLVLRGVVVAQEVEVLESVDGALLEDLAQDLRGLGALEVDLAEHAVLVLHVGLEGAHVLLQVVGHNGSPARVDDQQVVLPVLVHVVDDAVVHDMGFLVEDHRVAAGPLGQLLDVAGQAELKEPEGVLARHPDQAHVADVEDAALFNDEKVFLHCPRLVPQGHLPAAEIGQLPLQLVMHVVQRCFLDQAKSLLTSSDTSLSRQFHLFHRFGTVAPRLSE